MQNPMQTPNNTGSGTPALEGAPRSEIHENRTAPPPASIDAKGKETAP